MCKRSLGSQIHFLTNVWTMLSCNRELRLPEAAVLKTQTSPTHPKQPGKLFLQDFLGEPKQDS